MKHLTIGLFIFIFYCCSNKIENRDDLVPFDDSSFNAIKFDDKDREITLPTMGSYDSAQYRVGRIRYTSGRVCWETLTDSISGIRHERNYEPDGRLYAEGSINIEGGYHVGIWRYYYSDGRVKQINFDSTLQTSYYQAIQIAKKCGFGKGRLEISEELNESTYYWKVIDWTDETSFDGTGQYLMIRRSNGKVTIPKDNKMSWIE